MDKISSYFNDCFTDNYYVMVLTHKTNVNLDEEVKHIETTKTIVFDQSIQEEAAHAGEDSEERKQALGASKIAIISKEAAFVTHYITNLNVELGEPIMSKGMVVYPLMDLRNKIHTERKFDDFVLLRKAFVANFPSCFIPVLPPKAFYVRTPAVYRRPWVSSPRNSAATMLSPSSGLVCSSSPISPDHVLPHLKKRVELFQAFIDPNCYVAKTLERHMKPRVEDVAQMFKVAFQNLAGLSLDETLYGKIDKFDEFAAASLRRSKQLLEQIRQYVKLEGTAISTEFSFYSELKALEQIVLQGNFSENAESGLNTTFMLRLHDLSKLVLTCCLFFFPDLCSHELTKASCSCSSTFCCMSSTTSR
jgi:hypothetical protein